jgi:flagellar hook-basal body complex protein FliE
MATNAFAAGAYAATQSLTALGQGKKPVAGPAATGLDFGAMLQGAVDGVAQSGRKAEMQALAAANGKADIVDVVTAVAESEAALETLVAVRDRVIAAYEEIMRMPI